MILYVSKYFKDIVFKSGIVDALLQMIEEIDDGPSFKLEEDPILDYIEAFLNKNGLECNFGVVLSDYAKRHFLSERDVKVHPNFLHPLFPYFEYFMNLLNRDEIESPYKRITRLEIYACAICKLNAPLDPNG
jgi:hypothetical protein